MHSQPSTPAKAGRARAHSKPSGKMRGQSLNQTAIHGELPGDHLRSGTSQTGGQFSSVNHKRRASGTSQIGDQVVSDLHTMRVADHIESGGAHRSADIHERTGSTAIDEIREQWRRRQMWHRAEKSLTLQAKSMCRRLLAGDKKEAEVLYKSALNGKDHAMSEVAYLAMMPLLQARDGIEKSRLLVEKALLQLVKELPVYNWILALRGVGPLSLAGIVGEAGDLSSYGNPAKLWKRMGLAVINGERQRKKEGEAGIVHGYNPSRRSLMWTVGDCIIRAGGPLKELYNQRKEYEAPRVKTKMHAHNRAKRYIEKRLLRDLWRAWRDANRCLPTNNGVHLSEVIQ
jgi:hypothetical protein